MILVKVLSLIAGICALGYVAFKALIKHGFERKKASHGLLQVVAYERIDQKTSVCLIKVPGGSYLLAIGNEALALEKITPGE